MSNDDLNLNFNFDDFGSMRCLLAPIANPAGKNTCGDGFFKRGTSQREIRRFKERVIKKARRLKIQHQSSSITCKSRGFI